MSPIVPQRGPGRLQWQFSGWLGAQLGGTAWILLGGFVVMPEDRSSGLLLVALGAAANVVGLSLWRMRTRLTPHFGIQSLIATEAVVTLATLIILHAGGHMPRLEPRFSPAANYLLMLVFPAAAVLFWRQNRPWPARP